MKTIHLPMLPTLLLLSALVAVGADGPPDPDAQCKLGLCYHQGKGVAKDEVEADAW